MKFEVDKQTLKDLEIFDTFRSGISMFKLFNQTQCLGGRKKLFTFLSTPLTDKDGICGRRDAISFFQSYMTSELNIDKNALDFTEFYLKHAAYSPRLVSKYTAWERKLLDKIRPSQEYYVIEKGVSSTVELLKNIYDFSSKLYTKLQKYNGPESLSKNNEEALRILSQPDFKEILEVKKIKVSDSPRFDYMFRRTAKNSILFFLNLIYEYDAYLSIARAAHKYHLNYPEIAESDDKCLDIEGLFHPFVNNAIASDIDFGEHINLLFISGPNMAGKSTFLKALGVATYLAHAGFPVPAHKMKFSILSGLCTTINISDDLSSGYSHFYAEVMRIKDVANRLEKNNNMLVIFDELFRGTNVKDAYDGTLAIVSALSEITTSFFVVSTHIVEAAYALQRNSNIRFSYVEVDEQNGYPVYTYKLKDGISDVRLGMYIINKEKLIEQIKRIKTK